VTSTALYPLRFLGTQVWSDHRTNERTHSPPLVGTNPSRSRAISVMACPQGRRSHGARVDYQAIDAPTKKAATEQAVAL
jgi:hypothetical protein